MGKNAKKLRRQDWETELEAEIEEKPKARKRATAEPESADQFQKPAPQYRAGPGKHNFRDGQVVLVNGSTPVTIIAVLGDTLCCLENNGLLHYVPHYQLLKTS